MVSEKVSKYISLDPEGTFFQDEGITWDENLQEPVAIEFICKMPFPRLLGQRQDVPELDPTYVPIPGHIEDIRAGMYANQNIALSGPPGSGKSSLIQQLAARLNRPFYITDVNEDIRPEIFFGETRPFNGNQLQFQDGAITKAFRTKGSIYLMDEANMASPGVLAKCHRAYAGFEIYLEENNYECVKKAPGVTMFMACNALNNSTEAQLHSGVQQMNRAFLDRFGVTIRTDYPNEKEETHILMNALEKHYKKEFPKLIKSGLRDVLKKIVEVAQKIRVQIKDGVLPISFSVRRTVGLAMLYCYYEDVTRAVRASILNMEEPDDAESIDIVFKTVFGDQYTSLGELTNDSSKEKQF